MSNDTITPEALTEITAKLAERLDMARFEAPFDMEHTHSIGQFAGVSYVFHQAAAAMRLSAMSGASKDSAAVRMLPLLLALP